VGQSASIGFVGRLRCTTAAPKTLVHQARKLRQDTTTMSSKKSSGSVKKVEPETFNTRDIVLGKLRGWPAWPGMVSIVHCFFCDFWRFLAALVPSGPLVLNDCRRALGSITPSESVLTTLE
jgi:hypothetical protein